MINILKYMLIGLGMIVVATFSISIIIATREVLERKKLIRENDKKND